MRPPELDARVIQLDHLSLLKLAVPSDPGWRHSLSLARISPVYIPSAFREDDPEVLYATMRSARL